MEEAAIAKYCAACAPADQSATFVPRVTRCSRGPMHFALHSWQLHKCGAPPFLTCSTSAVG
eukprot:scaffold102907_cov34-Tisochrysis_lutea.AAC.3